MMNSTSDVFVSLHGIAHNLHKVTVEEYFTKVPRGLRVYTFAPTNYCVYSNEDSEKMMKHFLQSSAWMTSPECRKGGMFEHAQLYLPGSTITNLILDGDTPTNYGMYLLDNPAQKLPVVFDAEKKETTYDIERLLNELKPSNPRKIRNVYLCICFPHTISAPANSVIKWSGRIQPERKATKKYDSFSMSPELLEKARKIQTKRIALDHEGRQRFLDYVPTQERRFTRSMNFPVKGRNGSIDHIPAQVGKGLGEKTSDSERGMFFKIDKIDRETDQIYKTRF